MPEPVQLRPSHTPDPAAAIYLIGHGPLHEPRFIELQHMRIRRYLRLLADHEARHFRIVSTFVDINFPRVEVMDPDAQAKLPGLVALHGAIASGSVQAVLLDHAVESLSDYFQPFHLAKLGVEVLNASYEGAELIAQVLRTGPNVPLEFSAAPREAEDFVTYFPAGAARVTDYLVEHWNPKPRTIAQLQGRSADLRGDNPYRFGREPRWSQRRQVEPDT